MIEKKCNKNSILAVLTGNGTMSVFLRALERAGLSRNIQFTTFTDTSNVDQLVLPDTTQLMFIDLLLFDLQRTIKYVEEMKKKNAQLIVILYSPPQMTDSVFDAYIRDNENVISQVGHFATQFLHDRWPSTSD